ncbi:hypothetical protein KIL84_019991, partial [Mauremys mutica]
FINTRKAVADRGKGSSSHRSQTHLFLYHLGYSPIKSKPFKPTIFLLNKVESFAIIKTNPR